MHSQNLNTIIQFLMSHSYLFLFLFSCIEGSMVSTAAGVLARLGYFNIFIVLIISILGDLIPDIIYYYIGKNGHNFFKKKKIIGDNNSRFKNLINLKELSEKHPIKSLVFVKFSPFIGHFGLIAIGSFKPDVKKYIKNVFVISIFKSLFFVFLGYLSGSAYVYIVKLINSVEKGVLIAIVIVVIGFILYKIFMKKELKDIESEEEKLI